jgi:1-acyl-sn-glycerol-3-phosphate acyltransferase
MRGFRERPMTPREGPGRPPNQLARYWRAFRTGLAFAVFGIGALIIAFVIIPVLRLAPGGRPDRTIRVQAVVHHGFRWFEWFMSVLGLIRVSRVGFERLAGNGPRLVIANHPTLIDVILLGASLPQADCIVKKATLRNPYLRGVVTAAGYIPNDEGDKLVDACARGLRAGRTLLMFPEGTRSPRGELGRIQRGAAHVALRSGVPLLPVVITCDPPTLMKGQPWYEVPERTAHLTLVAQHPIDPAVYATNCESGPAAARRLNREIQAAFLGSRSDASNSSVPARQDTVVAHGP